MARNYKRDGRGRFAKVGKSALKGASTVGRRIAADKNYEREVMASKRQLRADLSGVKRRKTYTVRENLGGGVYAVQNLKGTQIRKNAKQQHALRVSNAKANYKAAFYGTKVKK
ncbi:hypothetical protein [Nocardia phage P3.1]|nr:hypothetical protein [Nocardia phage P3.1]